MARSIANVVLKRLRIILYKLKEQKIENFISQTVFDFIKVLLFF